MLDRPPAFFIADHLALDFLNSIASPRGVPIEWLRDGRDLVDWLEQAHVIGPDVADGNIPGVNGLVFTNPADDCYRSLTGSTLNGTGGPFTFNASVCYGLSGPLAPPSPPSNLSATVN